MKIANGIAVFGIWAGGVAVPAYAIAISGATDMFALLVVTAICATIATGVAATG